MSPSSLKTIALALIVFVAIGATTAAQSPNQLAISAAVANLTGNTVTLTGSNFTDRSDPDVRVWLNRVPLAIQSMTPTQVIVTLPAGFGAGSYQLEMTRTNGNGGGNASTNGPRYGAITVTIGAVGLTGAQGPQGIQGSQGPAGAQGAVGPAGPAGPAGAAGATGPGGAIGPVGPAGPAGDVGPVGPAGAVGPVGAAGLTGVTGPRGLQGVRGPGGVRGFEEFPYDGNFHFTVPAEVSEVLIEVWGSGGGGGGASLLFPGGGGGGGAYAKAVIPVTAGQILAVTVGRAGSRGYGSYSCLLGQAASAGGNGGWSGVSDAGGASLAAGGGFGGQGGEWLPGDGGAGVGFSNSFAFTRGLLARGGFGGHKGRTLGLQAAGGPTPTGSVGLPFGLGGGDGGSDAFCPAGQSGNQGLVIISW